MRTQNLFLENFLADTTNLFKEIAHVHVHYLCSAMIIQHAYADRITVRLKNVVPILHNIYGERERS